MKNVNGGCVGAVVIVLGVIAVLCAMGYAIVTEEIHESEYAELERECVGPECRRALQTALEDGYVSRWEAKGIVKAQKRDWAARLRDD